MEESTKVIVTFMDLQNIPRLTKIYVWSHSNCLFTEVYFFYEYFYGSLQWLQHFSMQQDF